MTDFNAHKALENAKKAFQKAYTPYSGYQAGLCLYTDHGEYYTGCSVENAAYTGCDAVTAALGRLVAESGWVEAGTLPRVQQALYCVPSFDVKRSDHLPESIALSHLSFFAGQNAQLLFASAESDKAEDHRNLHDFLPYTYHHGFTAEQIKQRQIDLGTIDGSDPVLRQLQHVRHQAFNPYSHYCVGAMVRTTDDQVFYGCNFEIGRNSGIHAEAMAIAAMVSALGPQAQISEVTILTQTAGAFPCGDCRQKINEFALLDTKITCLGMDGTIKRGLHKDVLPGAFGRDQLIS